MLIPNVKEGSRSRKGQLSWVVPLKEGSRDRKRQLPWVVTLKGLEIIKLCKYSGHVFQN